MAGAGWYFEAELSDGKTVRDLQGSGRSPWIAMVEESASRGVRVKSLSLMNESGFSVTLPVSDKYFHLKKAVFELSGNSDPIQSYAVGFMSGENVIFVWGNPDSTLRIESRSLSSAQSRYMMPGVS